MTSTATFRRAGLQPPRDARRLAPACRSRSRSAPSVIGRRAGSGAGSWTAQRLCHHRHRRHDHHHGAGAGDGAGRQHVAAADHRRGARRRLVEGEGQQAPIAPAYDHPIFKAQFVVGSLTTRGYWMPCRMAGAQARRVLLDAAAERWNVPVAELTTEPSAVVHAASGRRMGYGEIAGFAKVPEKMPEIKPDQLKPAQQFRLIGKDVPRLDVADKVDGQAALRHRRAGAGHGVRHARARAGARLRPELVQPRRDQDAARHHRCGRARPWRRHHRQHASRRCSPRAAS